MGAKVVAGVQLFGMAQAKNAKAEAIRNNLKASTWHLMEVFTNESRRYFDDVMETDAFDKLFHGVAVLLIREKQGKRDLVIGEDVAGNAPWFATYSLTDHKNYGIEVKAGSNPGNTVTRLLADRKIDYIYYLKGETKGGRTEDGKIQSVPLYLAAGAVTYLMAHSLSTSFFSINGTFSLGNYRRKAKRRFPLINQFRNAILYQSKRL